MKTGKFRQLSNCSIGPKRSVVISKLDDGSFTIGQQLEVDEGKSPTYIFLKGALHVWDAEGLQNLRDAITLALQKDEKC